MAIIQGNAKGSGVTGFYSFQIEQSLRFNDGDTAYLSRTATAGESKIWTLSFWMKPSGASTGQVIFGAGPNSSNLTRIDYRADKRFQIFNSASGVANGSLVFDPYKFRDPSAWYHFVFVVNTPASETDRYQFYVNGERLTGISSTPGENTYPSSSATTQVNTAVNHEIGRRIVSNSEYLDAYLAEMHFIDGTAYDADDFGELKSGVWVAKSPSVTYGTNGFHLDFANSADIGNDVSGEGNDWTPNNFSAYDVVPDSPTNNFATWNPLEERNQHDIVPPDDFTGTLAEGNLKWDSPTCSTRNHSATSTFWVDSGKWYWEGVMTRDSGGQSRFAMGTKYFSNRFDWFYASTASVGTVYGIKVDLDANSLQYTTDGTTYTNFTAHASNSSSLGDYPLTAMFVGCNSAGVANFGQDSTFAGTETAGGNTDDNGIGDFYYTPPSGFLALCTANLPEPSISPADDASPSDYFNPVLYAGTSTTNSVTGVGFQPDFVWIKDRTTANSHAMFDVVRGTSAAGTTNIAIGSDRPDAEGNGNGVLSSFNTDGFTVDDGSSGSFPDTLVNDSPDNYVAWNWKSGGAPTTDNVAGAGAVPTAGSVKVDGVNSTSALAGSIAATRISANTEAGFSIVSYTGTGGGTVDHKLGATPEMIIVKRRNASENWGVYHQAMGPTKAMSLDASGGEDTSSVYWNNTAPTSDVFSVGVWGGSGASGGTYIAYCFTPIEGFSKFGSFTGYQITDGPFVYTGFRPAFLLVKNANFSEIWPMWDSKRNPENPVNLPVYADLPSNESTAREIDFLSNGFKIRNADTSDNRSGDTHIYMAFAENPFKYANAR